MSISRTENVKVYPFMLKITDGEGLIPFYAIDEREFGKYRYTNEAKYELFKDLIDEGWNCLSYEYNMVAVVHTGVGVVKTGELTKESREVLDSF